MSASRPAQAISFCQLTIKLLGTTTSARLIVPVCSMPARNAVQVRVLPSPMSLHGVKFPFAIGWQTENARPQNASLSK